MRLAMRLFYANKIVPFQFILPKKSLKSTEQIKEEQIQQARKKINTKKLSRNGISDIRKRLKLITQTPAENESFTAGQLLYESNKQKRIQDNLKTRNFQNRQYFRGQQLLDNIPLVPGSRYLVEDYLKSLKEKYENVYRQNTIQEVNENMSEATQLRVLNDAYNQKQKQFELQEFQNHLACYPGTIKGPNPQDDIDAYIEYGYAKMPQFLRQEIKIEHLRKDEVMNEEESEEADLEASAGDQAVEQSEHEGEAIGEQAEEDNFQSAENQSNDQKKTIDIPSIGQQTHSYSSILTANSYSQKEVQEDIQKNGQSFFFQDSDSTPYVDAVQLPMPQFPPSPFENYQQYMNQCIQWSHFRRFYFQKNGNVAVYKSIQSLSRVLNFKLKGELFFELKHNIPSLCRYYSCLPKVVQDHPGMKDLYLGLEYRSPDYSFEEKEQAFNEYAVYALPYDRVSHKAMEDFTAKKKYYVTPFIMDKMYTMDAMCTMDLNSFLTQIKQQQIRGEISPQEKEAKWPEPPQAHKKWDDAPSLPVNYYDNEDGFWTPLIKEKHKRYDNCTPMLRERKHFKH